MMLEFIYKNLNRYLMKSKVVRNSNEEDDLMFDENGNLANPTYVIYNRIQDSSGSHFNEVGYYNKVFIFYMANLFVSYSLNKYSLVNIFTLKYIHYSN